MIAAGWFMHKHPPRKINPVVGYRTARSMRNMDAWLFAQKKAGVIWEKTGIISLIASALLQIPFLFLSVDALSTVSVILMFVQLAALFFTIFLVERALKKAFSDAKEIKP
ncbi:MAG: SdpI family protein [Clostridia bacterium]|nr:SdpI family protein [Clostridia bacterium]